MNKFFLIILSCFCLQIVTAQTNASINQQINLILFNQFKEPLKSKKIFLKTSESNLSNYNPFFYISGGLLFFYQIVFSEQIQASCSYQMSCSENMKHQIKHKGLLKGILSGVNQLGNCTNNAKNDYPSYKITDDGKINNTID